MESLVKFEAWLKSNNIDPKYFIFPLDRIIFKLGYCGKPIVYLNFWLSVLFVSAFWFIGMASISYVIFGLLFQLPIIEIFLNDMFPFILISISVGLMVSYSNRKRKKKHSLPEWKTFGNLF